MTICITGKLNKAAKQFAAQDSIGFNIRLGVKFYNRNTKTDEYTNYSAVIFAKSPAQIEFYQNTLVEGAIVEVSGDKCRIDQYQGQNGLSLSIEILDAKVGFVFNPQQQRPQKQTQQVQQPQAPQQRRQAPPAGYHGQMPQQGYNQQRPQQGFNQSPSFDDDIGF